MSLRLLVPTFVLVSLLCLAVPVSAQVAGPDEALTVAKNWVSLIVAKRGAWGESPTAEVTGIQELRLSPDSRLLGYFCPVSPKGWIVISYYKDLASVKAYSELDDLDISETDGVAAFVKEGLDGMINSVEKRLGKPMSQAKSKEIQGTLNVNFRSSWRLLGGDRTTNTDGAIEPADTTRTPLTANYQGGQILTLTKWRQGDPYNRQCPAGSGCDHTLVGCVATAGAQVMRYWCWPPAGSGSPYDDGYDWPNMPNTISASSPQEQIDAIAELGREIGHAVGMDYGCSSSSADTGDMEGVYEGPYRYADCNWTARHNGWPWPFDSYNYSADEWFNMIKDNLNINRVVHYRIKGHSIVCDGWQEIGDPVVKQYHMNYGWGNSNYAWYTLDALHQSDSSGTIKDEKMVQNVRPNRALGPTIANNYDREAGFPFRYFDQDATCADYAWFLPGQGLQFLPNIVFRATGTGNWTWFDGEAGLTTRLFTRGDQTKGIRIDSGSIRMNQGGALVLR